MSAAEPFDPWSVAAAAAREAAAAVGVIPREWFDLAPDAAAAVRDRAYVLQRASTPAALAWQQALTEHRETSARRAELRAAIAVELRAALRRPVSRILRRGVRR